MANVEALWNDAPSALPERQDGAADGWLDTRRLIRSSDRAGSPITVTESRLADTYPRVSGRATRHLKNARSMAARVRNGEQPEPVLLAGFQAFELVCRLS